MGIQAAGTYIRALREARHIGRGTLASTLGIDHTQIERIEKGQTDTRGSLLLRILHTLQGDPNQLMELIVDPNATHEDAQRMAKEWMERRPLQLVREDVIQLVEGLAADSMRFQRWLGYGDCLLEEIQADKGR